MSPAQQRTFNRAIALFLAAGAGDAIVQFATTGFYDWKHLLGGLTIAAVLGAEKWLSEQNPETAAPTVTGVNAALHLNANVPPPTVTVEHWALGVTTPPEGPPA